MSDEKVNYKDTLNITRTSFPQRAGLAKSEPERMAKWAAMGLDAKIDAKGEGRQKYVLHDGPPYANGDIHLGHALNKTLKDIVARYKTMRGFHSHYRPGFDCHGLPIEQKAIEKVGLKAAREMPAIELRRVCHEYATKYIGLQTEQFKRLGVGGEWERPYLTLDPQYEVGILEGLKRMVERGLVYRGFKPVYWDPHYQTALAEAEIEYEEHTSKAIYVRFPVLNPETSDVTKDEGDVTVVIWTTTPWTLPGNMAVTVHPELQYLLLDVDGEKIICAKGLADAFIQDAGLPEPKRLKEFLGKELEGLNCSHPLLERESVVILGEHVTLEQGTGCVHTAPGHGMEDFEVCQKYGIETIVPVDERGLYTEDYPEMQGEFVEKCNGKIVDLLKEKGLLVHVGEITHQYPYSWRSHKPIIYRATNQWFFRLDDESDRIREDSLKAIDGVRWIPKWGRDRIYNMMDGRPDWCLSRQRAWGVPIPVLRSKKSGVSMLTPEIVDKFQKKVAELGSDCWFTLPAEEFVPDGLTCPEGGTEFEKEFDILDVWFDSGSSHISVLEADEMLDSPADLYLEGSDQHRGWFMSSLLVSMAARDRAPYKAVLTHGFLLDGEGNAMSKSKGNTISPLKIIDQMGADVLRLWVISEDFRADMRASDAIFKQMMETYRRVRNTLRFMLGNLEDFDAETNMVAAKERTELDRWALTALAKLVTRVTEAFDAFEFHRIYHLLNQFCVVTMSSLYMDILKDRLYCSAPDDHVRRSAQSTVHDIFSAMVRMIAPVMPFTADEAYEYNHPRLESVHLEDYPEVDADWEDAALSEKWDRLLQIRDVINPALEEARREKKIGKSLDGGVALTPKGEDLADFVEANAELLRELCIVSYLKVDRSSAGDSSGETLAEQLGVEVVEPAGAKCARCWTFAETTGSDPDHADLCDRCSDVVRRLTDNG